MVYKNVWILNIFDQNLNDVFNVNRLSVFFGGWNGLNIPIKSGTTKLKVVFRKNEETYNFDIVENYCYFFNPQGILNHKETLKVVKNLEDEGCYFFWIDVPENTVWMNIEIDPNNNSGFFIIPGAYADDDYENKDRELRSEFIRNLKYFDNPEDYEIKKNKNKELFHSIKNYEELKKSINYKSTFTPRKMKNISSFFSLSQNLILKRISIRS